MKNIKKKWYVYNIFTTLLRQILSDKLLFTVIGEQKK